RMDGLECFAFRYDVTKTIALDQIEAWRAQGLRILAFRRQSGPAQPPSELSEPFRPGDAAIVAGPEEAIRALLSAAAPARIEPLPVEEMYQAANEKTVAVEEVSRRHGQR